MNLLFGFQGRIGRSMWWLSQICCVIVGAITLLYFHKAYGIHLERARVSGDMTTLLEEGSTPVLVVWCAALGLCFWISLSSTVKRLHDHDQSGWWALIGLIAIPYGQLWIFVGQLWVLMQCGLRAGTVEENRFGAQGSAVAPGEIASAKGEPDEKERMVRAMERLAAAQRRSTMACVCEEEEPQAEQIALPEAIRFGRRRSSGR